MTDIAGIQQTGVAILAAMQETLAKTVPTNSSGRLDAAALIQSGFVRVLGVSVTGGTGGVAHLHDCAVLADASTTNRVYAISNTLGFYPVNMVFHKGLVMTEVPGSTECTVFYSRI